MKTEVNRKKSKTKNMIRAEKRAEKIVVQKMTFGGKVANFLEIAFSFLSKSDYPSWGLQFYPSL